MAGRYLGQNIIALTWIGDGGSSTGAFHEGLNLAAQQCAPFVLIVENNQWAYSTPVSRQVPVKNLADRAAAYGIRSWIVDGNDVVAVYNASKEAVDECRQGRGPSLIEVKTMRMRGHAQHDPAEYVPKQMFDYWKARDPIALYEKYLTHNKIWDAKTQAEIDARIERELDVEQKFAEESAMPPPELAEEGVYCEGCHEIEAAWQRPKAELLPPACSIEPGWEVKDYGAFTKGQADTKQIAAPGMSGGGNGSQIAKPVVVKHAGKPQQKTPVRVMEPETPAVPRVPFGRGPKDKSVREVQNPRDRHQNPRDKRGRR